jgi:hypothetical protein
MAAETSSPTAASEPATSPEEAYEYAGYYIRRWKTERFHHALKSGRAIAKAPLLICFLYYIIILF